jgi:glycosyltransferase involved in cell wall biosynthesis
MRIAQVVASYYPAVGGLETHVKALADGCAAAGDQVTVLTHQAGDAAGGPAADDVVTGEWAGAVRVLRFPLTVRAQHYPVSRGLFRYLREHAGDFDLIHAHNYHNLTGQAALSRGRPRRPLVFTPHYHGTGHTRLAAVLHQLYRPVGARLFRGADAVVCVSSAERDLVVAKFPAAAGKVTVIPNGIGPAREVPAGGHAGERHPVVLVIGRLERYKNVDLIIKAFGELPGPARLVIVGDGPDRPRLERYRQAGPAGHPVQFTGRVPDEVLGQLLAQAAVVVSASDHEAFGLTLAEGLRSGARVVASAIPAHACLAEMAGPAAPVILADPLDTGRFSAAIAASLAAGRIPPGAVALPSWADVTATTRELYAGLCAQAAPRAQTAPRSQSASRSRDPVLSEPD